MRRIPILVLVALALVPAATAQLVEQAEVDRAIDRAQAALTAFGRNRGRFGHGVGQNGLAILALLKSGVPADAPVIEECFPRLLKLTGRTYDCAVRLLVFERLMAADRGPGQTRRRRLEGIAKKDCSRLIRGQNAFGGWHYGRSSSGFDNSNTQYAILGLRAADQMGLVVPKKIWERSFRQILKQIARNGGMGYTSKSNPTASMTAGGLSSLVITRARAGLPDNAKLMKMAARLQPRMIGFLEKAWKPGARPWGFYTLYGLERAMAFAYLDRLGKRDWYGEGARWLIDRQLPGGMWNSESDQLSTAFALLFLARASRPTAKETPRAIVAIFDGLGAQANRKGIAAAAKKLVEQGPTVAPILIHFLEDDRRAVRDACVQALRALTGEFHGFEPRFDKARNRRAVQRWKAWARRDVDAK